MGQAKARKSEIAAIKNQPAINFTELKNGLTKMSVVLLHYHPDQDYNMTPAMDEAATQLSAKFGRLSAANFNALLEFRVKMEQCTTDNFGVDFENGVAALMWDTEEAMKRCNVPQPARVLHGLLDLVIGRVGQQSGVIQFNEGK